MTTFLLAIGVFAFFFFMLSVRLIFLKDGHFRGTCASQNPLLNQNGEICGLCGKSPEFCENKSSQLNSELPLIK
ncbi:MAG: hypothetical protein NZM38_06480 [Cytophagales bacterium]|nr:hypothetical protein [Cytophagales bacterium]MDW8384402.1 hypothetical protein [Flammeovirgaceae bacterium]